MGKDRVCTLLSDFLSVVCRVVEQVRDVGLDGVVFVRRGRGEHSHIVHRPAQLGDGVALQTEERNVLVNNTAG